MNKHLGVVRGVAVNVTADLHDFRVGVYREPMWWEMGELHMSIRIALPIVALVLTFKRRGRRERDDA